MSDSTTDHLPTSSTEGTPTEAPPRDAPPVQAPQDTRADAVDRDVEVREQSVVPDAVDVSSAEALPADALPADALPADPAAVDALGAGATVDEEGVPVTPDGGGDGGPDGQDAAEPQSKRARLEREGEVAADFLETLLDICDLDGDLDVDVEGDRAAVSIVDSEDGRVPRRLVGQDAQVLEALQELTRLAVQSATGERTRLMLDVAGHRAERRAELVEVAKRAISEVKESAASQALEPMSAFERKVVHDEVLAAGLVSESEGAEPRRYVVVLPR